MNGISAIAWLAAAYDNSAASAAAAVGAVSNTLAAPDMAKFENLDKPSADSLAMQPYWHLVRDIVTGADAMRANAKTYLPQLPHESDANWNYRKSVAKFTNIYRDILEGLASKPFSVPVLVEEKGLPKQIEEFCDDVDGSDNDLTVYASNYFFNGINDALDWIFIDYPDVPPATDDRGNPRMRSQQEEAELGLKPFWSRIVASNVLEVRSKVVGGVEQIQYFRVLEPGDERRVRIMYRVGDKAWWELYVEDREKSAGGSGTNGATTAWKFEKRGVFSIGLIPTVPFITGRRIGRRWFFHPAMRDAADTQVELYREESGLNHVTSLAAFPMIAANGISPERDEEGKAKPQPIGPMAILYGPMSGDGKAGSWEILQPSADVMNFLMTKCEKTQTALRELGRQPLTAQSQQLTVITTAIAAQKANSAVQMWAYGLQDALANALRITALWFGIRDWEPEVKVFTDFDVDGEGADDLNQLRQARDGGDLSQRSYWKELKRRNVLAPDFDPEAEEEALAEEGPGDDEVLDANGNPVKVDKTGKPIPAPAKPPTPAK